MVESGHGLLSDSVIWAHVLAHAEDVSLEGSLVAMCLRLFEGKLLFGVWESHGLAFLLLLFNESLAFAEGVLRHFIEREHIHTHDFFALELFDWNGCGLRIFEFVGGAVLSLH